MASRGVAAGTREWRVVYDSASGRYDVVRVAAPAPKKRPSRNYRRPPGPRKAPWA